MSSKRLDVLLIYPIWVTAAAGRGRLQRMLPPLGLLSIASVLESAGLSVQVIDLHAESVTPEEFVLRIRGLNPRFVGISVLSSHLVPAHHIAHLCKTHIPDCRIIVGGVHAEAYPEQMLSHSAIEAVACGDGEEIMLQFVQGQPLESIAGLCFRKEGQLQVNPPRPVEKNLDRYPFPAYHLVNFNHYFPAVGTYRSYPAINALMTRGCPGQCTFCNSARTVLRSRSPQMMVELLEHLRQEHGIRQVYFYDDTFTANPKAVREFCHLMIQRNVDIHFVCYARGDMFTEELADLLARAGCHQILIGIETGSELLMREIGKRIDREKYRQVVRIAHQNGLEVRGAFIVGHINETLQTLEETLQFAIDLDLDFYQPSILTPYPGTELYRTAKKEGRLLHEEFDRYGQGEVILRMNHLSAEELLRAYHRSFFRFYLRPKAIWKQLRRIRSFRHLKDLLQAFYVILVERLQARRGKRLLNWLNFDMNLTKQFALIPRRNQEPLTWEVRQKAYSSAEVGLEL